MIIFDLFDVKKVRLALVYALVSGVTVLLQIYVFSRISLLGVRPMFIPVTLVAIGMFKDGLWGGVFGAAAGLLCDMASSDTTVLYTAVFTAVGFLAGLAGQELINRRLYSYLIASAAALALTAFCQCLRLWLYRGTPPLSMLSTAGLQVLWSLPFGIPAYFAIRTATRRNDR